MYDRERVARGAGAAIAIWVLIALTFLSTGVTYAAPLAGLGGFNVSVGVVQSDSLALYPAVGDTSERDAYPQAIVELENTALEDLDAYKDLDVSSVPGLTGTARFRLASEGRVDSGNVLLKTATLSADDARFQGFSIEDEDTGDVRTSFEIFANDGARLENVDIRAHYFTSSSVDISSLSVAVCYDSNEDGTWERGPCSNTETSSNDNNAPYADATVTESMPEPGTAVTFDASSSADSDGTVQSYSWDFGDGTTATGQSVSHAYGSEGSYRATVTVTDDDGATDTAYVDVTVDDNQPVTVDASANQTTANPGELVVFDGFASTDEDGFIETYEWDFGDGTTATGDMVDHTYSSTGSYTVTFTATDDDGASATDTVNVTIEANQPPSTSLSANRTSTKIEEPIYFDGSGSTDSDGRVTNYSWDFDDGMTATGPNATHSYGSQGTYNVTLTVRDNDGATSSETVAISIAPNDPPTASATANRTSVNPDDAVGFDGTASSDPDGNITSYEWAFGDNTTATGATPTHAYSSTGTYDATLTVTDDNGATSTDTVQVSVALNAAPSASASANRTSVNPGDAIAFDASGSSDADGSISSYDWTFGDNSTATGATTTHSYSATGTYNATVTVTDDDGATSQATVQVTVSNNAAPSASASANRTSVDPGEAIAFSGSATDSDGTIESYEWTFGDGATATGSDVTHTYGSTGTYNATLTVTDDDGATGTATVEVTVANNAAPTASSTANRTAVNPGDVIQFDGSGSSDSDGSITSYDWAFGDGTNENGPTPTHNFSATGTYNVSMTVTDDDGATDSAFVEVVVSTNSSPSASVTANRTTVNTSEAISFDATGSSDADGSIESYDWTFGDNSTATGATTTHSYGSTGTYTVEVTVTDDDGATGTATVEVTVN